MNRDNSFGPGHLVALYIDTVPNRNSPPAILLHEGWREGGKVKKRTLANLSKWPQEKIESLRRLLKNEPLVRREEAFDIERSLPVHSFPTLLADLATIAKNRVIPRLSGAIRSPSSSGPPPFSDAGPPGWCSMLTIRVN